MNRPLIGITCNEFDPRSSDISSPYRPALACSLDSAYSQALLQAGGLAVLLPTPRELEWQQLEPIAREVIRRIDGLLLSGGADFNPLILHEEPEAGMGRISPERDAWEQALLAAALQQAKPVLAICRGVQVLNAVAGGTLWQDLAARTHLKHFQEAPRYQPTHTVRFLPGSRMGGALGLTAKDGVIEVNSFHHQAIRRPAPGFRISCVARDGVIEGIEKMEGPVPVWGVQWHPEGMVHHHPLQMKLFRTWLQEVERCR